MLISRNWLNSLCNCLINLFVCSESKWNWRQLNFGFLEFWACCRTLIATKRGFNSFSLQFCVDRPGSKIVRRPENWNPSGRRAEYNFRIKRSECEVDEKSKYVGTGKWWRAQLRPAAMIHRAANKIVAISLSPQTQSPLSGYGCGRLYRRSTTLWKINDHINFHIQIRCARQPLIEANAAKTTEHDSD